MTAPHGQGFGDVTTMAAATSQMRASGQPAQGAGQSAQVGAKEVMTYWSYLVEFAKLVADALIALCQLLES